MIIVRALFRVFYSFAYWFGCSILRPSQINSSGVNFKISPTASIKFPGNISVGDNVFINHNCCVWASNISKITVGNDVLLGPGVVIISSNHGIRLGAKIASQAENAADVFIGSDVWIGANSIVLPGVVIGDGCVVGAGAVVSRSLPANSICVGTPARPINFRKQ